MGMSIPGRSGQGSNERWGKVSDFRETESSTGAAGSEQAVLLRMEPAGASSPSPGPNRTSWESFFPLLSLSFDERGWCLRQESFWDT